MDEKYYCYFFTRQDISPEQQLVQTAHVALKLGVKAKENVVPNAPCVPHQKIIDPDETYFTCIGVRDLAALNAVKEILQHFCYNYESFYEPDLNEELTSIALYPIKESDRGPLLAFNLLKMASKG